jgi:hypothetical protein
VCRGLLLNDEKVIENRIQHQRLNGQVETLTLPQQQRVIGRLVDIERAAPNPAKRARWMRGPVLQA